MAKSFGGRFYFFIGVLAMVGLHMAAYAADPSPLQDFCVGIINPSAEQSVNGLFCKNPRDVTADDFLYRGYNTPGSTKNELGSSPMMIDATILPSLNTLGLSVARVDFAPGGVNPPHLHPRASEVLAVIEGTLYAGFVTSDRIDGSTKLFAAQLNKGDLFVFPQGLIHFQINTGRTKAVANVAFGSQHPGRVSVANAVFGSEEPIGLDVLSKAFRVDEDVVKEIQSKFHQEEAINHEEEAIKQE